MLTHVNIFNIRYISRHTCKKFNVTHVKYVKYHVHKYVKYHVHTTYIFIYHALSCTHSDIYININALSCTHSYLYKRITLHINLYKRIIMGVPLESALNPVRLVSPCGAHNPYLFFFCFF